jgi:hypothetical protein
MENQTPSIVYRTRSLDEAKNLATYLTQRGINARLAVENPHGYFGEIPVTDFVHEVMAVDYGTEAIRKHITQWERIRRDLRLASESPYCYHCGQSLSAQTAICPECGQPLRDAD